jgi:hypothetical protein
MNIAATESVHYEAHRQQARHPCSGIIRFGTDTNTLTSSGSRIRGRCIPWLSVNLRRFEVVGWMVPKVCRIDGYAASHHRKMRTRPNIAIVTHSRSCFISIQNPNAKYEALRKVRQSLATPTIYERVYAQIPAPPSLKKFKKPLSGLSHVKVLGPGVTVRKTSQ